MNEAKELLDCREDKAVDEREWFNFTGDQKILVLCVQREDTDYIENDLEATENVEIDVGQLQSSKYFHRLLRTGLSADMKVTEFHLSYVGITDQGVSYILESKVFEKLDLLENFSIDAALTAGGAKKLFLALLKANVQSREMSFFSCCFTGENFDLFAEYFSTNETLSSLTLWDNPSITPQMNNLVVSSLQASHIQYLNLMNIGLEGANVSTLIQFLQDAITLEYFSVQDNILDKEALTTLYDAVSELDIENKLFVYLHSQKNWDPVKQNLFHINETATALSKNKSLDFQNLYIQGEFGRYTVPEEATDKEKCFLFTEGNVCDFSEFLYDAARSGANGFITAALSSLTLEEKTGLKASVNKKIGEEGKESIRQIVKENGTFRVHETLDALDEILSE
eukprot:augustus_masked-scaffold_7-processed-gene-3.11-mRNA-1 protein AED:1.00 eAED:1.00 QI:0/-1/0/0/-1/1/1/0/395